MGRPRGWASQQTGRPMMPSPGRSGVNQLGTKQAFWKCIARGMESEGAALACGMSQPLGPRWSREAGGMAPIELAPSSDRYLSFSEREELALLWTQGHGVREIARQLHRSPSTISRELYWNAATGRGTRTYRTTVAQWEAERAAERSKAAKLAENERLRIYVQNRLAGAVTDSRGKPIAGPNVPWKGRRHGRRADHLLESRTDQPPLASQLSGRRVYADLPRTHLSGTLNSGPEALLPGNTKRSDGPYTRGRLPYTPRLMCAR